MADTNKNDQNNVTEVIRGGREVDVVFADGSKDTVFVKELAWHKNKELTEIVTESAMRVVSSVTGLDEQTLERLNQDSFFDLHIAAIEVNMPNVNKWGKHLERVTSNPHMIAFQKDTGGSS